MKADGLDKPNHGALEYERLSIAVTVLGNSSVHTVLHCSWLALTCNARYDRMPNRLPEGVKIRPKSILTHARGDSGYKS